MTESSRIVLESAEERLWIDNRAVQLHRTVFRLLTLFAERQGRLVTKREILRHVWPETNVSDASVKNCVKSLRAVLGDDAGTPVYIETVRGRGYRYLGGISVTERVAEETTDVASVTPAAPSKATEASGRRNIRLPLALTGVLAAVAIAAGASFIWRAQPDFAPARKDEIAFAIPEKPSIAVTPFVNVKADAEVDWLSIGLSSSLISALAASPDMVVISQNAPNYMSGVKPGEIAERFGVRYVLDGTVQNEAGNLRVSARLADALAGRTLWSDKWDRTLDDIFSIQDEITDAILEELQVRLTIGEQARSWRVYAGSPENMRAAVVGRGAFQTFTPEGHSEAVRLWNGIHQRNPELPMSMTLQGWVHWHKVMVGISTDPRADLKAAQDWAQKAIDAGLGGQPHILYAIAANYLGQQEKALEYAEQGLVAAPGEADVVQTVGFVYSENGRLKEGINLMQRGMRLEPDYPDWLAGTMVISLMKADRRKEARELADDIVKKGVRDVNAKIRALISLAVLSAWEQKTSEARRYLSKVLAIHPGLTLAQMRGNERYAALLDSAEDPDYSKRYAAALTAAGLPAGD